jgi:class 3 adenylate cyclase/tetratricopeptide (TPR) repeat protein
MSDIRGWLEELGLGNYVTAFETEEIGLSALPHLTETMLKELGLPMGPRAQVLAAIQKLSPPLDGNEKGEPRQAEREAERRQLTVMFCDLVGSTRLSERLDPEDLRRLMTAYRKAAGDVIDRYDGHVAQYLGDGVMAYFGWPRAHEDDGERAVRAALDIVAAVKSVEVTDPLQIRVGIATGPVVVGEGEDDDAEANKLAVGETPNLAARLQGLAGPDEIMIGQSTHDLIRGAFDYDELGEHSLKGIRAPVQVWRVMGQSAAEGRFEAQSIGGLTPFIGRDTEIAMVLDRLEKSKDGEGQVVLLEGEPGIGKSRITQELLESVADQPHIRLRYQCSPYYTNSAFYPIIGQLERAAEFVRAATADEKLDKLESLLAQGTKDVSKVAPLLASMLSLPIERYPPLNLSPQRQKDDTIAALAAQVTGLAQQQPVLFLFKDAHWCDPTTIETLTAVIGQIEMSRVLLVITYRPEFDPPWTHHGHVVVQSLSRLGKRQGADLVAKVTGGKALPEEVLDQIVAKTDGVPLFVEELTKTVLEAGFLTDQGDTYTLDGPLPPLAIPATLKDSLMARLDRLSLVKEVAQIGACIGREFSYELLAAVSPLGDNELQDSLQQLTNSALVFRRGTAPVSSYTFKHAMVQDAAYESLLKSRRQQLHQLIASVLQAQFGQIVRTQPELLARHLTEAGNPDQAIPYWYQAGQLAFVASAFPEAIAHLQNGLNLLPQISGKGARAKAELGLQTLLGLCLLSMYGYGADEVIGAFGRAERLIDHAEGANEIMPILLSAGAYHWVRGNFPKADGYFHRMTLVADDAEDEDLLVLGQGVYGSVRFHVGRGAEGIQLLEKSFISYDPTRHHELSIRLLGHDVQMRASAWMAITQGWLGHLDQAWKEIRRTVEMARDTRHPISSAIGLSQAAVGAMMFRHGKPALAWAQDCVTLCEEQDIPFWLGRARIARGVAHGLLGDLDQGIEDLKSAGILMDSIGAGYANGSIDMYLTEIYLKQGKLLEAEDSMTRLTSYVKKSGETFLWPAAHQLAAELDFARNGAHATKAEDLLKKALRIAREQEYRLSELRAAVSLAHLWKAQDNVSGARRLLASVYDWFTEGFNTADLKDARALLEELK